MLKAAPSPKEKDMVVHKPEAGPATPPLSENGAVVIDMTAESDAQEAEVGPSKKRSAELENQITVAKRARGRPRKETTAPAEEKAPNVTVEILNPPPEPEITSPLPDTKDNTETPAEPQDGNAKSVEEPSVDITSVDEETSTLAPEFNGEPDEVFIPDIQGPTALTLKILEVDGRIKNAPNGNAWKEIRCYRDNQDIGSLWEVRHAWHMKNR
jgi:hypothetical protein